MDARKYCAAYLADAEPCRFPQFDGDVDEVVRPLSIRVELEQLQELQKLSAQDKDTLPTVLRAAWALVLRCYTGLENVCFGYQETRRDILVNGTRKTAESLIGMPLARMSFAETQTLSELIAKAKDDYIRGLPYHDALPADLASGASSPERQLFNTAMLLRNYSNPSTAEEVVIPPQPLDMASFEEVSTQSTAPSPQFRRRSNRAITV